MSFGAPLADDGRYREPRAARGEGLHVLRREGVGGVLAQELLQRRRRLGPEARRDVGGKVCSLPFVYKGVTYDQCSFVDEFGTVQPAGARALCTLLLAPLLLHGRVAIKERLERLEVIS